MLRNEDKEAIRSYVAEVSDPEQKRARREECAELYDLNIQQVRALTAHTLIRQRKLGLFPPEPPTPGAAYDYDNPVKRKSRKVIKRFVAKNTHPEDRHKLKVLLMPGVKCLEIPDWLSLGFLPKNIVGVEKESTKEFLHNASEYGISVRTTDMIKVVDEEEWDIAYLDTTGPISRNFLDLLMNLKLKPNAILGTTLLAGREAKGADKGQNIIDYAHSVFSQLKELTQYYDHDYLEFIKISDELRKQNREKARNGELIDPETDLETKRNNAIPIIIANNMCFYNRPKWRVVDAPKVIRSNKQVRSLITAFFKGLWRVLHHDYRIDFKSVVTQCNQLIDIYAMLMAPYHSLDNFELYRYQSPYSKQIFFLDLYRVSLIRPSSIVIREVVNFINQSIDALSQQVNEWGFQVRDKKNFIVQKGDVVKDNYMLETKVNGSIVARVQLKSMSRAINQILEPMHKNMFLKYVSSQVSFIRREL